MPCFTAVCPLAIIVNTSSSAGSWLQAVEVTYGGGSTEAAATLADAEGWAALSIVLAHCVLCGGAHNMPASQLASSLQTISETVNGWASLAPKASLVEARLRALGFSHVLTAAEMHQLCLLVQLRLVDRRAERVHGQQQALALRETSLAASRQLCALQPGNAAYLLHLADAFHLLYVASDARKQFDAYGAALQAATASRGAGKAQGRWDTGPTPRPALNRHVKHGTPLSNRP